MICVRGDECEGWTVGGRGWRQRRVAVVSRAAPSTIHLPKQKMEHSQKACIRVTVAFVRAHTHTHTHSTFKLI